MSSPAIKKLSGQEIEWKQNTQRGKSAYPWDWFGGIWKLKAMMLWR